MGGSRIPDPIGDLGKYPTPRVIGHGGKFALFCIGASLLLAGPARAVDGNLVSPVLGQPVILSLPSPFAEATPAPSIRAAASTTPVKRSKPLIPPASPAPAKLGPPPDPRPALPLEIDLQPIAASPQSPSAGAAAPQTAKPPSG
jgi:hypothetical protein